MVLKKSKIFKNILIWSFISCFFSCSKAKQFITKEQYEIQKVEFTQRELQKLSQHILSNQEVMDKFDESKLTKIR